MSVEILSRLRSIYPSLTQGEQRVASTLLEHGYTITDWSGRELARQSGATEPAVYSLAHKFGLDGFKALKRALLEEEATVRARMELGVFNIPIHHDASVPTYVQDVLRAYVTSLQQTAAGVEAERMSQVAAQLRSARLVTLLGMGSSLAVASLAENIFVRCGIPCRLSLDSHVQLLHSLQHHEQHVVLAFSHSGETRETVEALRVARDHGAQCIAITAFENSSITQHADLVLHVPVTYVQPYRVGLVDAVLPFLLLLDVLAVLITLSDAEGADALRDQVEQLMRQRKLRDQVAPPLYVSQSDADMEHAEGERDDG